MYEETNRGYNIKESITFPNNRGFALGENLRAGSPFVTWQFTEENGKRYYYWGHYFSSESKANRDFAFRFSLYQIENGIVAVASFPEKPFFNYYFSRHVMDSDAFPRTEYGPSSFLNFGKRQYVEDGSFLASGIVVYSSPLSEKQLSDYGLRASKYNSQIATIPGQESPGKPKRSAPKIAR